MMKFVVALQVMGKKKFFAEFRNNGMGFSETMGAWTPKFTEKKAKSIVNKIMKNYHTIENVWMEEVA